MLQVKRNDDKAELTIDGYHLDGRSTNNLNAYTDSDVYLFNNGDYLEGDPYLRVNLFDLLKNRTIAEIPFSVQFNIIQVGANDPLPQPLERLPYPFRSITLGKKSNNDFIIRVDTPTDIDLSEEWENKWNAQHFFDSLLSLEEDNDSKVILRVIERTEPYEWYSEDIEIEVKINNEEITIDKSIDIAVTIINSVIKKAEIKLSGLEVIVKAVDVWEKNLENGGEKFWQNILQDHSWLIANCFSLPVMVHNNEAYLGGKNIKNGNGRIIDFLFRNKLTNNLSLIEIKTPLTKIIGKKYRNVYAMSEEFTGAITQLLDYRDQLLKDYYSLVVNGNEIFIASNPQLLLIVGTVSTLSQNQKKSFESFRQDLKSITIVTFDEMLEKAKMMLRVIDSNS